MKADQMGWFGWFKDWVKLELR